MTHLITSLSASRVLAQTLLWTAAIQERLKASMIKKKNQDDPNSSSKGKP